MRADDPVAKRPLGERVAAALRLVFRPGTVDDGFRTAWAMRNEAYWLVRRQSGRWENIAGDLWNQMENVRALWEGTEHEGQCELVIRAYEEEADLV